MKNHFEIEEFNRTGAELTQELEAKIKVHINEMNFIREKLGFPVMVSKNSGYRPRAYEQAKGRSGNSQHNFEGKGSADYTCSTPTKVKLLRDELIESSNYNRICYYPNNNFVHCDYKEGLRGYYEAESPKANWVLIKKI